MAAHCGQSSLQTRHFSNEHVPELRLDRGRARFVGRPVANALELAPACLSVACDLMMPPPTSPTLVEVHGEPGPNHLECPFEAYCDVLPGSKKTKLIVRTSNTTFEAKWLGGGGGEGETPTSVWKIKPAVCMWVSVGFVCPCRFGVCVRVSVVFLWTGTPCAAGPVIGPMNSNVMNHREAQISIKRIHEPFV